MLKYSNTFQIYKNLIVQLPSINFYIEKIKKDNLKFIKINHAFWDLLAGDGRILKSYVALHDKQLIKEDFEIIKKIHKTNIIFAVNPKGGPINTKEQILDSNQRLIKSSNTLLNIIPKNFIPHHAGVWKIESRKNNLVSFFETINRYEVVIVGLQHLSEIKHTCKIENFKHYVLNMKSSLKENRYKVLDDLTSLCQGLNKKVILLQAGDLLATWLVYNLAVEKQVQNCSVIDMGRSLDFYCPNRTLSTQDALIADKIHILKDFHYLP